MKFKKGDAVLVAKNNLKSDMEGGHFDEYIGRVGYVVSNKKNSQRLQRRALPFISEYGVRVRFKGDGDPSWWDESELRKATKERVALFRLKE